MQVNYSSTRLKPVIRNYGCRNRLPHDPVNLYNGKTVLVQVCKICNKKLRYRKGYKGRIDNRAYLEDHLRATAQQNGRTKRMYMKIHHPEKCIIHL